MNKNGSKAESIKLSLSQQIALTQTTSSVTKAEKDLVEMKAKMIAVMKECGLNPLQSWHMGEDGEVVLAESRVEGEAPHTGSTAGVGSSETDGG